MNKLLFYINYYFQLKIKRHIHSYHIKLSCGSVKTFLNPSVKTVKFPLNSNIFTDKNKLDSLELEENVNNTEINRESIISISRGNFYQIDEAENSSEMDTSIDNEFWEDFQRTGQLESEVI